MLASESAAATPSPFVPAQPSVPSAGRDGCLNMWLTSAISSSMSNVRELNPRVDHVVDLPERAGRHRINWTRVTRSMAVRGGWANLNSPISGIPA